MIRLSNIWKLYLIFTIVLIIIMSIAGFILESKLKERLKGHLKEEILTLAKVIAKALPNSENSSVLDLFCEDYQKIAGVRITIIKTDGKVIGESERESIGIDNHLKRPEVKDAVINGTGTAIRFSNTLNIDMFYVSLYLKENNKIIRLAMPMTNVKNIENGVMIFLSFALYLIPILAIIISFFFARYYIANSTS